MNLLESMTERAKKDKQRIVLPEGTETRTLRAADQLLRDGIADIILLGNPTEIHALADQFKLVNISRAQITDPKNHVKKETYKNLLLELRKKKGMTPEQAALLVEDPLYLACLMIKNGDADGEIAGAQNTTGDVLRPALQIIKTLPGVKVVSGAFIMYTQTPQYGENGILLFADCAVMPNPTAEELASIAVASAQTMKSLVGAEPKVAMLSFSTKGSAEHEMIDKVREATRIAKETSPSLLIDGELQADAALVPAVGASKAPGSLIAGKANVLVFPTLESGNIGYKLVQRLGNAEAVGPVLQGMAAPVNDLSRGCSVDDIYKMVVIAANQAIGMKQDN
ncbi:phosphate acetyltransferase [Proteiniphilum sp. UBA1028]|jgi:phosphate acetyltransferase|uniref:phosphate acetyltransferase n=1 Tax=Proteiniphilum sp. UBA1028 TaxID=1947251 RepID=UPI000E7F7BE0|nr:phosphate acetyltransferase [Proteiniphilum sp. UBA1028]HBG58894.1 phosphate acetyltransferase [Porphyromonadaceae bacterium]